jgi:4a-hydroxytetrahydrobiopterin dehydratase
MAAATKLSEAEITDKLEGLANWSELNGAIQRTFQFKDFVEAMKFVNAAADHAEAVQHHPDILIRWNKVTLTLSTHDAGGITQKDFDFASHADGLA